METLLNDVKFAFRTMRRRPYSTLVIIASLALGIALNLTFFAVVDASGLKWSAPDMDSLFQIYLDLNYADHKALRTELAPWGELFESTPWAMISPDDGPRDVLRQYVSGNYFSAIGLRPAAGALFQFPGAEPQDRPSEAVLSYSLWQKRFGGKSDVLGKTIRIGGNRQAQVVGIAPAGFSGLDEATVGIWVSAPRDPAGPWPQFFRLHSSISPKQGHAIIQSAVSHLPGLQKERRSRVLAQSLAERRRRNWTAVSIFMLIPGTVLIVACANASGFLAARADERREEMAIRQAIGGARQRLIRQMLVEGGLLAFASSAGGLFMAQLMIGVIAPWLVPVFLEHNQILDISLNYRSVLISAGLAVVTTVAAGILPALAASRANVAPLLKREPVLLGSRRRFQYRDLLVISQLTITFIMLSIAVLAGRNFYERLHKDMGFDSNKMLAIFISENSEAHQPGVFVINPQDNSRRYEEILEKALQLPDVRRATISTTTPIDYPSTIMRVRKQEHSSNDVGHSYNAVRPEYFDMAGIRLVGGKLIDETDVQFDHPVAVVNTVLATRAWGNENPLGRFLLIGSKSRQVEVVGVVQDHIRALGVENGIVAEFEVPGIYVPMSPQRLKVQGGIVLLVESSGNVEALGPVLEWMIHRDYPDLDVPPTKTIAGLNRYNMSSLEIILVSSLVMGFFCGLLAAVGVFSAVAQMVARRMREIGIRIAVGATRFEVLSLVFRRTLLVTLVSLVLGISVSVVLLRLIGTRVLQLPSPDVGTYAFVSALVLGASIVASYAPARWATRIDPMTVLRCE